MKRFTRFFLRLILTLIIAVLIWAAFNFPLVRYVVNQLKGQLHIVMNSRPLKEVIGDTAVVDSVKQKIYFIEKVKKFAIDSLGLKPSENYTTFYDQQGKPLLWVLTASEAFRIKAYEWKFPLLGSVSYKGFFDYEKGKSEEFTLTTEGFDTDFGEVSAWSTLGWFKDPVLSNMVYRGEGSLAELIIHELTHSTLFIKNNVNLNENLASVCGEQGAIRFLKYVYGNESKELVDFLNRKQDYNRFSNQMLIGAGKLDSLYSTMEDSMVILKKVAKDKLISEIVHSLDTVSFQNKNRFKNLFKKELPNNAYFLDFIRYDSQKEEMKTELINKFNGNIKAYIDYLREKYN